MLEGDGTTINHFDFLTQKTTIHEGEERNLSTKMTGHGFGDYFLMRDFVRAVVSSDPSFILSGPEEV